MHWAPDHRTLQVSIIMTLQESAVTSDDLSIPVCDSSLTPHVPTNISQLVDFSLFLHGTPAQRQATAKSILHGFQTTGFIYLSSHAIPPDVVSNVFATSAAFFQRPQAEKEALG